MQLTFQNEETLYGQTCCRSITAFNIGNLSLMIKGGRTALLYTCVMLNLGLHRGGQGCLHFAVLLYISLTGGMSFYGCEYRRWCLRSLSYVKVLFVAYAVIFTALCSEMHGRPAQALKRDRILRDVIKSGSCVSRDKT